MDIVFQGAESKIYLKEFFGKSALVKERFSKKYRNPQLDLILIADRMKSEMRNMIRCKQAGVKTPAIYFADWEKHIIYMEYFKNCLTAKNYIDKLEAEATAESDAKLYSLAKQIGEKLGLMHQKGIIHGDLTTSNILIVENEIVFIDFGLSVVSQSAEEKGVDLYVLEKALISTHANASEFLEQILLAYKDTVGKSSRDILAKLEDSRARGRKRTMVG